jgi:glycosyltransferase 2 family protein
MLKDKKVRGALQVLLSIALLFLLLSRVGFSEVAGILVSIDRTWYLLALVIFLFNIVIRSYRWFILLHSINDRPPFSRLLYLYFVGFFVNNFIPSGFGGDVVKIVSLRQQYGRGTEALSSVVMDRLTGLVGSSLIALVALIWNALNQTTPIALPSSLLAAITVMSVGIPVGFLLIRWKDPLAILARYYRTVNQLPFYGRVERLIDTVHRYPFPTLVYALLISLPFTLNLILIQYCIARAVSLDLPLAVFPLFVPLIALVNLLPFTLNGLGVREGVYLFLFVPLGVAPEAAVAMSLAFYFLRFGAGIVGGLLFAFSSIARLMNSPHAENL